MTDRPPFDAPFIWAVGIEDTNVGWPLRRLAGGLDEFALTRHYDYWREDLALAASIGANVDPLRLPLVPHQPGARRMGLELDRRGGGGGQPARPRADRRSRALRHADLAHGLVHRPRAIPMRWPTYAAAVARALPGTGAEHHPAQRAAGDGVLRRPARHLAAARNRRERLVAGGRVAGRRHPAQHPRHPRAAPEMQNRPCRGDACVDGAAPVSKRNACCSTARTISPPTSCSAASRSITTCGTGCIGNGIAPARLAALVAGAAAPDVIGVNYYPELSARQLARYEDKVVGVTFNAWTEGLASIIRGFVDRYELPMLVSETAVEGDDAHRVSWLDAVVGLLHSLRARGRAGHRPGVVAAVRFRRLEFCDRRPGDRGILLDHRRPRSRRSSRPAAAPGSTPISGAWGCGGWSPMAPTSVASPRPPPRPIWATRRPRCRHPQSRGPNHDSGAYRRRWRFRHRRNRPAAVRHLRRAYRPVRLWRHLRARPSARRRPGLSRGRA